jgi:hypothetical protein
MNTQRYVIENNGFSIKSTATGKVVAQGLPHFPIPDELREESDGAKRIYQSAEVLLKRLLKQAIIAGDQTGGGYRIKGDGTAIVDRNGRVVLQAKALYPSETYRGPDGELRKKLNAGPEEALVDILVEDAATPWVRDRWNNHGYERQFKDANLRVERVQGGWIALRDGAILAGHDNAPVLFISPEAAMTAATDTHSAPKSSALRFSHSSSLNVMNRGNK